MVASKLTQLVQTCQYQAGADCSPVKQILKKGDKDVNNTLREGKMAAETQTLYSSPL